MRLLGPPSLPNKPKKQKLSSKNQNLNSFKTMLTSSSIYPKKKNPRNLRIWGRRSDRPSLPSSRLKKRKRGKKYLKQSLHSQRLLKLLNWLSKLN